MRLFGGREAAKGHKYAVTIRGENFLISLDGEPTSCGFFTTRFVEAVDPDEAELKAVDLIRRELAAQVLNDRTDSPMMYLEEIRELQSFRGLRVPGTGFTWFCGSEEDHEPCSSQA